MNDIFFILKNILLKKINVRLTDSRIHEIKFKYALYDVDRIIMFTSSLPQYDTCTVMCRRKIIKLMTKLCDHEIPRLFSINLIIFLFYKLHECIMSELNTKQKHDINFNSALCIFFFLL